MQLPNANHNIPKRVLVVDDEAGVREIVSEIIMEMGYTVYGAESGEDALIFASKTPVDLVISDVRIKGMNGISLVRKLRKLFPKLPLAFMTAYADKDVKSMMADHKVDFILQKPFYMDELQGMVHRLTG
jgi:two-component system, response regulator FlrC